MPKAVIALTGEIGSGKGTLAAHLKSKLGERATVIKFSDVLKETLEVWGLPLVRMNFQTLSVVMEESFGPGTFNRAVKKRIEESPAEIVILDGIRWEKNMALIRSFPVNFLVYVTASPETRFRRLADRGEKSGELGMTREEFEDQEGLPNERMISMIGASADLEISNDGSLHDLESSAQDFIHARLLPALAA